MKAVSYSWDGFFYGMGYNILKGIAPERTTFAPYSEKPCPEKSRTNS